MLSVRRFQNQYHCVDLILFMFPRRRSRSSSRSRWSRHRRSHSRSREQRWRARSGSRDRSERERDRERRQKGFPSLKSQTLSGMYVNTNKPVNITFDTRQKKMTAVPVKYRFTCSLQHDTLGRSTRQENAAVWCHVPFRRVWPDWVHQRKFAWAHVSG